MRPIRCGMGGGDCTEEALALFTRFAERHGLYYEVEHGAPVEVVWNFPAQNGVALPFVLALQNGDELNFGVSDFWSSFFPFEKAADQFENALDAWIVGEARIAVTGPWGRVLQVWDNGRWRSVYGANRVLPVWRAPRRTIENRPLQRPA